MTDPQAIAARQRRHWEETYRSHPGMYGTQPSDPAVHAARVFRAAGANRILELGAGHGRDALFFAAEGFAVHATDLSATGLRQLRAHADERGLAGRVHAQLVDARHPLPYATGSFDGVYAHMLLCMALSTGEIRAAVDEIFRVLRPGGHLVYTVRHDGDPHFERGLAHGDDIYEHGGFAVHFFRRELVDALAAGWHLDDVHAFEEGDLPRQLWRITQTKP